MYLYINKYVLYIYTCVYIYIYIYCICRILYRGVYLEVVLHDHGRGMRERLEHLVESPAVVPGDFVVALKLLVFRSHRHVRQVRLLQVDHPTPVGADDLGRVGVSAVLAHHDGEKLGGRTQLQEFVQAAPHGDPVAGDHQDGNDGLTARRRRPVSIRRLPQRLLVLDLQQDVLLQLQLRLERIRHAQHVCHHVVGGPLGHVPLLPAGLAGLAGRRRGAAPEHQHKDGVPGDEQERATQNERASPADHGTDTLREVRWRRRTGGPSGKRCPGYGRRERKAGRRWTITRSPPEIWSHAGKLPERRGVNEGEDGRMEDGSRLGGESQF